MLGTTTETLTAAGIDSDTSRAAQGSVTGLVTTDANGNLAGRSAASLGLATQGEVNQNRTGIASAMALTRIANILPLDKTVAVSIGWGTFDGENAMAVGGIAAVTKNIYISGGGAYGVGARGSGAGGAASATFAW